MNKKPPNKTRIRAAAATALVAALSLVLSGCFVIPVLDDRSPFDDPFGASNAQIRKAIPKLQEALDQVDVGPDYKLVAGRKSNNCEGDCYLRLCVEIEAAEHLVASEAERLDIEDPVLAMPALRKPVYLELDLPDDVWLTASRTGITAAEALGLDVTVKSSYTRWSNPQGQEYVLAPSECAAVENSLGHFYDGYRNKARGLFEVYGLLQSRSCETTFKTTRIRGLVEKLGL